jgi:lactoylglutathione lyase
LSDPLVQRVDCIHVEVPDLESGLAFYRDRLGHELLWPAETSAGLKMEDGGSELVLNAEPWKWKTDLLVESAESASKRFEEAGGSVISGPFDIEIGKAVVVRDPWGNEFVLLDASKGQLATDADKNVVGVENYSGITLKGTRYAIDDVVRARSAVLDRFSDQ